MVKTISDFNFRNKLVLLRVDINSPVLSGKIIDNPRLAEAAQTIVSLLKKNASVVVIAHQGRKGDRDFLPLSQHAVLLSKHAKTRIRYIDDLFGKIAMTEINNLQPGNAIILRNVRGFPDEKAEDGDRYVRFCKLFDIYVNDAFSVSHRSQGSIIIPPSILPSCIGLAFERELSALTRFFINAKKTVFLIGGAKVDDYLPIFASLKNKNNRVLASGVLANLFLISRGVKLGYENRWAAENGYLPLIPELKKILDEYPSQIILPVDFAIGDRKIDKNAERKEVLLKDAPYDEKIWDVGSRTERIFLEELGKADSIFMKGPLGYSEIKAYANPTVSVLRRISELTKAKKVFSLIGGGHLSTTIKEYKIPGTFSHISTAGGALIAYISGKKLPGLEALEKSN